MLKKNIFSIVTAMIIMYLSMTSSHTFDKVPAFKIPGFDKFVHFAMFFGLMLVITIEHRKSIRSVSNLFLISLIPLSYGILIEILQRNLTVTRNGDFYDAIADSAGIFVSILMTIGIKPLKRLIFKLL